MPSVNQPLRLLLQDQLRLADARDQATIVAMSSGDNRIDVPTVGRAVSSAYEQLRNAAEYSEEHLLLQRAIKRFYRLNLFTARRAKQQLNVELISELVLAGYLQNNSISKQAVGQLDTILDSYLRAYEQLKTNSNKRERVAEWILACLSSDIEALLRSHNRRQALIAVAYQYFSEAIDRDYYKQSPDAAGYELSLYIAVHQALLKSDIDIVRADVRAMYGINPAETEQFLRINQQVDHYFACQLTTQLRRVVNRHGAPLRILKAMITSRTDLPELLNNQQSFMDAYRLQIAQEYVQVHNRLDTGLAKSVAFIFITKMLIGLAVEIPYDMITRGEVAWTPLMINLLFPPLYMVLLRLGINTPKPSNTQKLASLIQDMLFDDKVEMLVAPKARKIKPMRQIVYDILFSVPIAITIAILYALNFNIVQMIIFFVFFSTGSSLGFRLRAMVADLEVSHQSSGFFASIRDFLYLPFIVFGQWLSAEYRRFNIIGRMLDIIIELPLKTFFRLARQWMRFLDEQHEQLY